ncbi:MAG: hypothetical protein LBE91_12685 [Tannerella sp.]|jgi:hypothetical protein|nr:hypothetical protein [Tannerella sp.]
MKDLSDIPFIMGDKSWYLLSVFYARESWHELVTQINQFYRERKDKFSHCLLAFSEDKGERIDISLASLPGQENRKAEIEQFFLSFVEKLPSTRKAVFPYGNAVWDNYPNNTLLWWRFRTMDLSDLYVSFHQATFQFARSLIENDTSPDTLFSVCIYLIVKGLTCIEPKKQKTVLSRALHDTSIDFKNLSHVDSVKTLINERIDFREISSTLESYRNENESEFSPELKAWLTDVKILMDHYSYSQFCSFICTMFGLKGLRQLAILELINTWYNNIANE